MGDGLKTEEGKWDLKKIAQECRTELREIGIPIRDILEVIVCRDKYITGRIDEEWKGEFSLYISDIYRNPKYRLEEIKTVIFHQLLHSVKGCMNHGKTWMKYAERVDKKYGCSIAEQELSGKKPGANWDAERKNAVDIVKCCYLDYTEKLMGILDECSDELKNIGLPIGNVSKVQFVSHNHAAYGSCQKNNNKTFTICISQTYGKKEADIYGLKGLICHELLHTCPEDDTNSYTKIHGPKWREMARKTDRECGYRIMAQSYTDAVKKATGTVMFRYACPNCGGYYDVYGEEDKKRITKNSVWCIWCDQKMNIVKAKEIDRLGTVYSILGECRDKLRIAGIPIGKITGAGFVSSGSQTGLHDNWNGSYSIDLPEIYNNEEILYDNEFRSYLYRELIRTCKGCTGCGQQWEKYVQTAEKALGFSIMPISQK